MSNPFDIVNAPKEPQLPPSEKKDWRNHLVRDTGRKGVSDSLWPQYPILVKFRYDHPINITRNEKYDKDILNFEVYDMHNNPNIARIFPVQASTLLKDLSEKPDLTPGYWIIARYKEPRKTVNGVVTDWFTKYAAKNYPDLGSAQISYELVKGAMQ